LNKKAYSFFLKKNRRKNPIAKELSDGRYQPRVVKDKKKSFFIGHVDSEIIEPMTEVEADPKDQITQPHLDTSNIKNTEWKDLY